MCNKLWYLLKNRAIRIYCITIPFILILLKWLLNQEIIIRIKNTKTFDVKNISHRERWLDQMQPSQKKERRRIELNQFRCLQGTLIAL